MHATTNAARRGPALPAFVPGAPSLRLDRPGRLSALAARSCFDVPIVFFWDPSFARAFGAPGAGRFIARAGPPP